MQIAVIRHGKTEGNEQKRYIGTTDEPLCQNGRDALVRMKQMGAYPNVLRAYTSPLLRCRQTREIIFPHVEHVCVPDLREQAFGLFENHSYEELQFLPEYRNWVETAGDAQIPQGESRNAFHLRSCAAFCACVEGGLLLGGDIALVAHGGVMMAALQAYAHPKRGFYDWQAKNGHGFLLEANPLEWTKHKRVRLVCEIGSEGERVCGG